MNRSKSPTAYRLPRVPARALTIAVAACYATTPSWAVGPADLTFRNDPSATVVQSGNLTTITTTVNRSIADAVRFNVARPESVKIFQPNSGSSMLVNVLTPEPSTILGSVWSNGQFMLMNQAGVMVGPGARIDTAAFVASAVKINEADFLAGRLTFQNTPNAGSVTNQGYIKTASGGHVYLIGGGVKNESVAGEADSGIINAPGGEVILAAGASVNLVDTGTPGVKVEITGDSGNVTNLGTVMAEAGRIGMAGVLVKNSGTLNASSVVSEGGRIFLKASKDTYVDGDGRIVATGTKGGRVEVLGDRVAVMDNAAIDASGSNGGGTVLVGGDYQGKNAAVQNSRITYFGPGASLKADAQENGDGGKVIVWADDTTRAYGTISARGGESSGNGGFVETSGHKYLDVTGMRGVDTRAPNGQRGKWLLDPDDITIMPNSFTGTDTYGGGTFTGNPLLLSGGTGSTSTVYGANIRTYLQTSDVILTTGTGGTGNITFQAGTYTFTPTNSATYSLSLLAYGGGSSTGNFSLPSGTNITMGTGSLTMVAGWDGVSTSAPATVSNKGDISYVGGTMSVGGALTMKAGKNIIIGGSDATSISSNGAQTITAEGTLALYGGAGTSNQSALLYSQSSQTVTAKQINLYGGGTSASVVSGSTAEIVAYGDQVITAGDKSNASGGGGILIKAGGLAGYASYNNAAGIFHGRDSTSGTYSGDQKFTIYGGGTFQITGGSGNGTGGSYDTACGSNCNVSANNSARAKNYKGSQTVDFIYGGSLSLNGGTEGNGNSAELENKAASLQKIYSSYGSSIGASNYYPRITVTGGSSGGTAVWGGTGYGGTGTAKVYELDNSAGISSGDDSISGTQTIYAYSSSGLPAIGVYGGATVSNTGVASGYIGANGTSTITAYGNIYLKGGGSNGSSNQYERVSSVAAIGNDKNVTNLSISAVGGRVDVYGGAGKRGHALIGSIDGYANVSISGETGVSMVAGYGGSGNYGGVYIGSLAKTKPDPYTKVKITTGASGTITASGGSESGYGGVYLGTFYNYTTSPSIYVAANGTSMSYPSIDLDFTETTTVPTSVTSSIDNTISSTSNSNPNSDSSDTSANTTTVTTTATGSGSSSSLTSGTVGGGEGQFGGSDSSSSSSSTGSSSSDSSSTSAASSSSDTKEGSGTEKKDDKKDEKKDDKKKDGDTKAGDKKDDGAGKKQVAQCKG